MLDEIKKIFFPGERFSDIYRHVGYSSLGVPDPWKPTVKQCVIDIEKLMWPKYLPFWFKRLIHYLATGNSVVRVKHWWAYDLEKRITKGIIIQDIKDKFATLRIYGYFTKEIQEIIDKTDKICQTICENCGGVAVDATYQNGWLKNLCKKCKDETIKSFTR